MRGLMRLLIMFGPMIFRQIQKMQRSRSRNQPTQYPDRQIPQRGARNQQRGRANEMRTREDRGDYVEYKDLNAELGRPTEEEKAMNLKEDQIMLDKEDLRHYDTTAQAPTNSMEDEIDKIEKKKVKNPIDKDDLKDLFLD